MGTKKALTRKAAKRFSDQELAARAREHEHRRLLRAERRVKATMRLIERAMDARARAELALAQRIATDHDHDLVPSERHAAVNE